MFPLILTTDLTSLIRPGLISVDILHSNSMMSSRRFIMASPVSVLLVESSFNHQQLFAIDHGVGMFGYSLTF